MAGDDKRINSSESWFPLNLSTIDAKQSSFRMAAGNIRVIPDRFRSYIPLILSEVLKMSQVAPILFKKEEVEWKAVIVNSNTPLFNRIFSENGRWLPDYVPYMLRILPFTREVDGSWSVDDGALFAREEGLPFTDQSGRPSKQISGILNEIRSVNSELIIFNKILETLEGVGLLVPFPLIFRTNVMATQYSNFFAVDPIKLLDLDKHWIGSLVNASVSSIDIAMASLFSMRLLDGFFPASSSADIDMRLEEILKVAAYEHPFVPQTQTSFLEISPPVHLSFELDDSIALDFSEFIEK